MSIESDVYAAGLVGMATGLVDVIGGTVRVVAVTSGYAFSDSHDFLDDVGGGVRLGTPATLTGKTFGSVGKGKFNAASLTYTGVAAAAVVDGFVGHLYTGSDATSRLLWYVNHGSDAVELAYTADGAGVAVAWPLGFIFSI